MNEDNLTGFKKRLSAIEICAYETLRIHHVFQSLILFAVIHGYHNRRETYGAPQKSKTAIHCITLVTFFLTLRNKHCYLPLNIPVSLSRFHTPF